MEAMSSREREAGPEQVLQAVRRALTVVPNLVRELGKSPAAGRVYAEGQRVLGRGSLLPKERLVVGLAASAHNGCADCLFTGRAAAAAVGILPDDVAAVEAGRAPRDPFLAPFVVATHLILETRGRISGNELARLEDAGVDRRRLYEIVALVGLESITNCVSHIAHLEADPALHSASTTGPTRREVQR
jgi:AhpD family alkylhydroperoxidase